MTHWWHALAGDLQARNRASEALKDDRYTDDDVRRSAVYTREDISFLIGLTLALNRQALSIRNILLAILAVALYVAFRISFLR